MPARTVLGVLGLILAVGVLVEIVLISQQVLTWILIAVFFTLALNPLVDWFHRRGVKRRGWAVGSSTCSCSPRSPRVAPCSSRRSSTR